MIFIRHFAATNPTIASIVDSAFPSSRLADGLNIEVPGTRAIFPVLAKKKPPQWIAADGHGGGA